MLVADAHALSAGAAHPPVVHGGNVAPRGATEMIVTEKLDHTTAVVSNSPAMTVPQASTASADEDGPSPFGPRSKPLFLDVGRNELVNGIPDASMATAAGDGPSPFRLSPGTLPPVVG